MAKHSIKTILNTTIGRNIDNESYRFYDALRVINKIYDYSCEPENMTDYDLEEAMQTVIANCGLLHDYRDDIHQLITILTWSESRYNWIFNIVDFTMKMKSKYPVK